MERIVKYYDLMEKFLSEPGNAEFKKLFPNYHITLVCDGLALTGSAKAAFDGYKARRALTHINWKTFLLRTRRAHEGFLNEAERQRKLS
jgi:hypothetical protein